MSEMPPILKPWFDRGSLVDIDGNNIFVIATKPRDETVFILHGFPSSTFDWHNVLPRLESRFRVVTFDYLGYGFSAKPLDARYSLFEFADMAERVASLYGIERCTLAAHDIGDSVAAELLARGSARSFDIDRVVLTNGSIFVDMAQLTAGQQALLAMPDEPLPGPFPLEAFRPGLEATFAEPDTEEIDAMLYLLELHEGSRLLPRQIRYIEERRANQPRWTAGLVDFDGPMTLGWGGSDPINTPAVADRLRTLRPATTIHHWPEVAHWPPSEASDRVADLILSQEG